MTLPAGLIPKTFDGVWDSSRSSTATYVGSDRLIKSAAVDEERIDYDPSTGECKGLLVEEQRTNLLLQSEDSTETEWTQTIGWARERTAEVGSPESTSGQADKLTRETLGNSNFARQNVNLTGTTGKKYTASLYVHVPSGQISSSLECTGDFDDRDKFPSVGPIPEDTWHRVEGLTVEATADIGTVDFIMQDEGGPSDLPVGFTIYTYGFQLEEGSTPSSYIPTTTSQETRAADSVSRVLGSEFNASEGAIFLDVSKEYLPAGETRYMFSLSDGTTGELIGLRRLSSGSFDLVAISGGSLNNVSVANPSAPFKVAFSYSADGYTLALNGETIGSFSAPVANVTNAYIGGLNNSSNFAAPILALADFEYYPHGLPATELQELTK